MGQLMKALLDTNIIIDYLNGIAQAQTELSRHEQCAISVVTWMEVMVGALGELAEPTEQFLRRFECINIDESVASEAVQLRQKHKIKLPDAIVWASARVHGYLLVTRNVKDFSPDAVGVRLPYTL